MPCTPININFPDGPSGTPIPGFGLAFGLNLAQTPTNTTVENTVVKVRPTPDGYENYVTVSNIVVSVDSIVRKDDTKKEKTNYAINCKIGKGKENKNIIINNYLKNYLPENTPVIVTYDAPIELPKLPELNDLYKLLQLSLPIGNLKPSFSSNYDKNILDGIVKILDQFLPFLMLYKLFLPILKMILCILEVICALPNPYKVIKAVKKLFRECVPLFLSLFPILALILMIISILLIIIQIIVFIIQFIIRFILLLLREIRTLYNAFAYADVTAILAIIRKIGVELCLLQNLFVIFLVIQLIVQVFQDLLNNLFAIPPCDDSNSDCCTPDVCPKFIKNGGYERNTGVLQYNSRAVLNLDLNAFSSLFSNGLIPDQFKSVFNNIKRNASYQFYDPSSASAPPGKYLTDGVTAVDSDAKYQTFINMIQAYDIVNNPDYNSSIPIFFPTDAVYDANTPPSQAPYTVDLTFDYDPQKFGRSAPAETSTTSNKIQVTFKDCIVVAPTSDKLYDRTGGFTYSSTGVLSIAGGKGYLGDGTDTSDSKILFGYDSNQKELASKDDSGNVIKTNQATLSNFIFLNQVNLSETYPNLTDIPGIDYVQFENIKYNFNINYAVLYSKALVTAGCIPEINVNRQIMNAVVRDDYKEKEIALQNFQFPDIDGLLKCVDVAISEFRNDITEQGAINLQTTLISCLNQLKDDCEKKAADLIPASFDQYKSSFSLSPTKQFTGHPIKVKVKLKCTNGQDMVNVKSQDLSNSGASIINNLPDGVASLIGNKIKANATFGDVSSFTYHLQDENNVDGYYTADITSEVEGEGQITISFDGKTIGKFNNPVDLNQLPTVEDLVLKYSFIYTPSSVGYQGGVGDQSDGQAPRRDDSDISRDNSTTGE